MMNMKFGIFLAISLLLATLLAAGGVVADDGDDAEEETDESDDGEDLLDSPVYCYFYGWPPSPYCVI